MLTNYDTNFATTYVQEDPSEERTGLSHLLAAAVINPQFRELLLENPESALERGYRGEVFELSREERERIVSGRAHSLADLAKRIILS